MKIKMENKSGQIYEVDMGLSRFYELISIMFYLDKLLIGQGEKNNSLLNALNKQTDKQLNTKLKCLI
jgi:hypothetical protein